LHEFAAREPESTLTPARHGVTLAVRSQITATVSPPLRVAQRGALLHHVAPGHGARRVIDQESYIRAHLEAWPCWLSKFSVVESRTHCVGPAAGRVRAAGDFLVRRKHSPQPARAITRASVRLASVLSRLSAQTIDTLQPLPGLTALTGPSDEPESGCCVMARRQLILAVLTAVSSHTNSTPSSRSYGFCWNGMTARAQ
jgi:hypothetical protein